MRLGFLRPEFVWGCDWIEREGLYDVRCLDGRVWCTGTRLLARCLAFWAVDRVIPTLRGAGNGMKGTGWENYAVVSCVELFGIVGKKSFFYVEIMFIMDEGLGARAYARLRNTVADAGVKPQKASTSLSTTTASPQMLSNPTAGEDRFSHSI
jgi:hypothetical protein